MLNDTWIWDGTTWTKLNPATSPSGLAYASMAYDAATGQLVLFGGMDAATNQALGDTWTWDGTTWTKQTRDPTPAPQPLPASMAYDPATAQLVLFGGVDGTRRLSG